MTFEVFNLHARLSAGIQAAGYTRPTPIQQQAIPAALAGHDLLGLAQTGTGKTAAFVLPLLHRLLAGPRGHIRALIVAPTRELAEQIHTEIGTLARGTGLRSATVYGGVGMTPQVRALKGNAEIIVACPGRLLDHLERKNADLSKLEVLVLDEADHMFDMGFLPAVRAIVRRVPASAQRLLFSATMPDDLRQLASAVLKNPVTVEVGRVAPAETVAHALYPVATSQKSDLLKHLLRKDDARRVLVFTRTKHGAKRLAEQLNKDNFFAASLQGNLSQNKRQQALDGFREGRHHILVATDIAARGIDVTGVSHVINYDVPTTAEAYTHRIGRTGRAERNGQAVTFVTHEDEKTARAIERSLATQLPRIRVEGFIYQANPEQSDTRGTRPSLPKLGGSGSPEGQSKQRGSRGNRRPQRDHADTAKRHKNRSRVNAQKSTRES